METKPYTPDYHQTIREGSRASARAIVPLVVDLVAPASVVDLGCGTGAWLATFVEHGISDVLGIDGESMQTELLEIPKERFVARDLSRPVSLERRFELAVCLEVAEHLSHESADDLVDSLVAAAPVVLFSAAIPGQGGEGHVNEQWPDYWVERFARRDYLAVDCIRRRVWEDPAVEYWYAQNSFLFVARGELEVRPRLRRERELANGFPVSVVHPRKYVELIDWCAEKLGWRE